MPDAAIWFNAFVISLVCGLAWSIWREIELQRVARENRANQGVQRRILNKLQGMDTRNTEAHHGLHSELERLHEKLKDWVQDMRYDRLVDKRQAGTHIYNTHSEGDRQQIDSVEVTGDQSNIGRTHIDGEQRKQQH